MSSIFHSFINNIQSIVEQGGYIVLLLISILEGLPIIGPLVPGHTVVIFSGFLAKIDVLNILIVVPIVLFGATLGDFTGYLLGRKYGLSLFHSLVHRFGRFFFVKKEHIEKVQNLVKNHMGKSIIFGRFNPLTRPLTPFIVGASDVPMGKFFFFDVIGVCIWGVGSIALGYIFGASYGIASAYAGKFVVMAFVISILIIWGYRFINKQFHIFAKYELIALIINILSLYVFFKTIQDTLSIKSFLTEIDVWMNLFFLSHAQNFLLSTMEIITNILSPISIVIVGFISIIYFIYKKNWQYSLITFLSISGGVFFGTTIKHLVLRVRPVDSFILETGYSFPSGHATMATIAFALIIYFYAREIRSLIKREIFILVMVILAILVAFSRVYLGVHWFSDVIAGISLGLFLTTLNILIVRYIILIVEKIRAR